MTTKISSNLQNWDAPLSMGYENILVSGGLADYFDNGEMFLYVEDDAEFLIAYYIHLEELVRKPDNYEHNAYLTDGQYTLRAKSDRKIVEIKFNSYPGLRAVNLVTNTATTSENEYIWWWRSIANELINFVSIN
jgi:hypothetical protein